MVNSRHRKSGSGSRGGRGRGRQRNRNRDLLGPRAPPPAADTRIKLKHMQSEILTELAELAEQARLLESDLQTLEFDHGLLLRNQLNQQPGHPPLPATSGFSDQNLQPLPSQPAPEPPMPSASGVGSGEPAAGPSCSTLHEMLPSQQVASAQGVQAADGPSLSDLHHQEPLSLNEAAGPSISSRHPYLQCLPGSPHPLQQDAGGFELAVGEGTSGGNPAENTIGRYMIPHQELIQSELTAGPTAFLENNSGLDQEQDQGRILEEIQSLLNAVAVWLEEPEIETEMDSEQKARLEAWMSDLLTEITRDIDQEKMIPSASTTGPAASLGNPNRVDQGQEEQRNLEENQGSGNVQRDPEFSQSIIDENGVEKREAGLQSLVIDCMFR